MKRTAATISEALGVPEGDSSRARMASAVQSLTGQPCQTPAKQYPPSGSDLKRTAATISEALGVPEGDSSRARMASAVQSLTGQPCQTPAKQYPPSGSTRSIERASRESANCPWNCCVARNRSARASGARTSTCRDDAASASVANDVSHVLDRAPVTRAPAWSSSQNQSSIFAKAFSASGSWGSAA